MVAQLNYCRVTGTIVPVDSSGQVIQTAVAKLAQAKPLTIPDMSRIHGFRLPINVSARRVGTEEKMFIAFRYTMVRDDQWICRGQVIHDFQPTFAINNALTLPVPPGNYSRLGTWKISVGYAGIYQAELVPSKTKQILECLPYVTKDTNIFSFTVIESDEIKPNGEYAHRVDSSGLSQTGDNSPSEI